MQNAVEIRRRMKAVEQTMKLTRAMQLVSTARMRSVLQGLDYNQRYYERIQETMKDILLSTDGEISHPYINRHRGRRNLYIVICSDKGMAGSYNAALLRFAEEEMQKKPAAALITIGNVAAAFFKAKGRKIDKAYYGFSHRPPLALARHLMEHIIEWYDENEIDQVKVIYTSFYGKTKNHPVNRRLLPIRLHDYDDVHETGALRQVAYHPSAQALIDAIVPQYLVGLIYEVMVQSYASENFMRMNAMRSATKNAEELFLKLKVQYNMARQSAITQEITEITGAAEALLGERHHE